MANITHDAWIFAETALEDLPQEYFTHCDGLPILKDTEAWLLFKCDPFASDIIIANIEPVKGELLRKDFRAVTGAHLVVEASGTATNIVFEASYSGVAEDPEDINRCGNPREREAMEKLMDRIDDFAHKR